MEVAQSVPNGWEVVTAPKPIAASVPDGWEVVTPAKNISKEKGNDSGALPIAAASALISPAANAAAAFGTSPTAARTIGAVARGATTLGAVAHGVASGSPSEIIAAPMEGWAAGKGGYFLGKGMQAVARPIATALEKAAPYAQALSTASGAQGALDLAQMAEPTRKDIGFLGIGGGTPDPNHPALLNLLAMKATDGIKALVAEGLSKAEAARVYFNLKSAVARQGASK